MTTPTVQEAAAQVQQVAVQAAAGVKTWGKKINWRLVWARLLYFAWAVFMKVVLSVIYFSLISLGFLHVYQDTGQKLYKLPIPGIEVLEDYEWTYNLKIAHFCAIVLLVLTWLSWNLLLRLFLSAELLEKFRRWNWNLPWVKGLLIVGSVLVIVGDAGLFYSALQYAAFGETQFSPFTLVAALVWVVILVLVNFISIYLSRCATEELQKQDDQPCSPPS